MADKDPLESNELQKKQEELRKAAGVSTIVTNNNTGSIERNTAAFDENTDAIQRIISAYESHGRTSKKVSKDLETFDGSIENVKDHLKNFSTQLLNGKTSLDNTIGTITALTKTVGTVTSQFGPFGKIVGGAITTISEAVKPLIEEATRQLDAFQKLSEVGANTAEGIDGLQKSAFDTLLTLDNLAKVVGQNSKSFVAYGDTVSDGVKAFESVQTELANFDDGLRNLGFTVDDMAEGTATYLTLQAKLGKAEKLTQEQLTQSTSDYLRELDELTRLTGASKKELEEHQKEVMREQRFRANLYLMEKQGQDAQVKQIQKLDAALAAVSPDIAKGMRDSISGSLADSPEALQLATATRGGSLEVGQQLKRGEITADEAMTLLKPMFKEAADVYSPMAAVVDNKIVTPINQLLDASQQLGDPTTAREESIAAEEKATDQTKGLVGAQKNLEQSSSELHKLLSKGVPTMTVAVNEATKAFKGLTSVVNDLTGGTGDKAVKAATKTGSQAKKVTDVVDQVGGAAVGFVDRGGRRGAGGAETGDGRVSGGTRTGGFGGGPSKAFSADVESAIKQASEKHGIDTGYMRTMAMIESGGRSNASNASGAKGLYQFIPSTAKNYGLSGREFDPASAADAAARLTKDNMKILQKSGITPTPELLYLAHQQGAGGVVQLMRAANQGKGWDQLDPSLRRNMASNSGRGKSAQEFIDFWGESYRKRAGTTAKISPTVAQQGPTEPTQVVNVEKEGLGHVVPYKPKNQPAPAVPETPNNGPQTVQQPADQTEFVGPVRPESKLSPPDLTQFTNQPNIAQPAPIDPNMVYRSEQTMNASPNQGFNRQQTVSSFTPRLTSLGATGFGSTSSTIPTGFYPSSTGVGGDIGGMAGTVMGGQNMGNLGTILGGVLGRSMGGNSPQGGIPGIGSIGGILGGMTGSSIPPIYAPTGTGIGGALGGVLGNAVGGQNMGNLGTIFGGVLGRSMGGNSPQGGIPGIGSIGGILGGMTGRAIPPIYGMGGNFGGMGGLLGAGLSSMTSGLTSPGMSAPQGGFSGMEAVNPSSQIPQAEPTGQAAPDQNGGGSSDMSTLMSAQLDKLSELGNLMRKGNSTTEKILKAQK